LSRITQHNDGGCEMRAPVLGATALALSAVTASAADLAAPAYSYAAPAYVAPALVYSAAPVYAAPVYHRAARLCGTGACLHSSSGVGLLRGVAGRCFAANI